MVKNIRVSDEVYEYLRKRVEYPESVSDALAKLLGLNKKK